VCANFYPDRLIFGSMRAKNFFGVKQRTAKPMLGRQPPYATKVIVVLLTSVPLSSHCIPSCCTLHCHTVRSEPGPCMRRSPALICRRSSTRDHRRIDVDATTKTITSRHLSDGKPSWRTQSTPCRSNPATNTRTQSDQRQCLTTAGSQVNAYNGTLWYVQIKSDTLKQLENVDARVCRCS